MALCSNVSSSGILKVKNRGGLTIPSNDVVYLCKMGEKILRQTQLLNVKNLLNRLVTLSMQDIKSDIFMQLYELVANCPPIDNHVHQLKKAVLYEYFKVRLHHEARLHTEKLHDARVRSFHTKIILFKNQ